MTKIFDQLKKFISDREGVPIAKIYPKSVFERDLGIYGDDLFELLIAYSKEFSVNIAEFDFKAYVSPEGDMLLSSIINSIAAKKKVVKDLTVAHLIKGIESGKLDEAGMA